MTFIQLPVQLNGGENEICYFPHLVLGSVLQPNCIPFTPIHALDREFHCRQVCVPTPHVGYILLHILVPVCVCGFFFFFYRGSHGMKNIHLFFFMCQTA